MNKRSTTPSNGFTLLEVLVALAIFGIASGVLFTAFNSGLREVSASPASHAAVGLARSLLASAEAQELVDGQKVGATSDGFQWSVRISPYGDGQDRAAWPVAAHVVSVEVRWREDHRVRSIDLVSMRLGRKDAAR